MAQRRVVVTGIGLISSVGSGTEECWSALQRGESGIASITQFDASDFAARIAGEVKNFDPLAFVEKKELKKMGRFIQFAIAASEFASTTASPPADPLTYLPAVASESTVWIAMGSSPRNSALIM